MPTREPEQLDTRDTPCLLLDEAKVRANVARMRTRIEGLGAHFRPHLKTAKSLEVARIAMHGCMGPAMLLTLHEAEYFAKGAAGISSPASASPAKLPRISAIRAAGVDLAIILDSIE